MKNDYREEYLADRRVDLDRFDEFLDTIEGALDHQPEGLRDRENREIALNLVARFKRLLWVDTASNLQQGETS